MDLSEIRPAPIATLATEKIGSIKLTGLTIGGIEALSKELEKPNGSLDEFVHTFIESTCRKEGGEAISRDEVEQFSESEKAYLVRAYVEKKHVEAGLQREDGESDASFLRRIITNEIPDLAKMSDLLKAASDATAPLKAAIASAQASLAPHREAMEKIAAATRVHLFDDRWKKLTDTIKPTFISAELRKSLQREASANSALMDSIRRVQSGVAPTVSAEPLRIPKMPPPPILETNQRLNEINGQLEAMKEMAVQMATTVSAVSESSSQFVEDFAAASADANRASKIAACLAAFGILAAVAQIFYAAYSDRQKDPETKAAIAEITTKIEALSVLVSERGGVAHQDAEKIREALGEISTNLRTVSHADPTTPKPQKAKPPQKDAKSHPKS
jgi:hypothetical protein